MTITLKLAVKVIPLWAAIILMYSCSHTGVKNKITNKWIQDSCGCKHIRNNILAKKLIDEYGLMNNDKDKFLSVFGSPNQVEQGENHEALIYYFDSLCDGNKPSEGSDTSFAIFYFKSGNLTYMTSKIQ